MANFHTPCILQLVKLGASMAWVANASAAALLGDTGSWKGQGFCMFLPVPRYQTQPPTWSHPFHKEEEFRNPNQTTQKNDRKNDEKNIKNKPINKKWFLIMDVQTIQVWRTKLPKSEADIATYNTILVWCSWTLTKWDSSFAKICYNRKSSHEQNRRQKKSESPAASLQLQANALLYIYIYVYIYILYISI